MVIRLNNYKARKIDRGVDNSIIIGVFKDSKLIGSYSRNYPIMFDTFYPFLDPRTDKELALYSPDYSSTRVMSLPSCLDIGGEQPSTAGFCPVEYSVIDLGWKGIFGFVQGCVFGDDSDFNLESIDLSEVSDGKIKVYPKYGCVELKIGIPLRRSLLVKDNIISLILE